MPKPATTRLGLPQYEDSEHASFSAQINAITTALDSKVFRFDSGTGALPGFGIPGRYYLKTNGTASGCAEGDLYYDTGTAWVGPRNIITGPPLGSMMDYALPSDPVDPDGVTRWMVCDGRAILRSTYAAFFAKVNAVTGLLAAWGVGNGTTTFNIPNFVGRTAVHPGGSGVTANGAGALNGLAEKGGEQLHKLTIAELPNGVVEPHLVGNYANNVYANPGFIGSDYVVTGGGGAAHNNMQPYVGAYKIIRVL